MGTLSPLHPPELLLVGVLGPPYWDAALQSILPCLEWIMGVNGKTIHPDTMQIQRALQ